MLKMIGGFLQYDTTGAADTDRDAFESVLNTELAKNSVVPNCICKYYTATSLVTNDATNKTIDFKVLYGAHNSAITDFDAFWTTVVAEKDKATVLTGTTIRKCDFLHDVNLPNTNWTIENK